MHRRSKNILFFYPTLNKIFCSMTFLRAGYVPVQCLRAGYVKTCISVCFIPDFKVSVFLFLDEMYDREELKMEFHIYFLYSFILSQLSCTFKSALKLLLILGPLSCLLPAPFHGEGTWENLSYERVGYDCNKS